MEITCKDLAEKLLLFQDGDLCEVETDFLRQHLRYCPHCMDLLKSYEEVVDILHRLKPVDVPADLLVRLHKRMQNP
jgi:hypothetical protein